MSALTKDVGCVSELDEVVVIAHDALYNVCAGCSVVRHQESRKQGEQNTWAEVEPVPINKPPESKQTVLAERVALEKKPIWTSSLEAGCYSANHLLPLHRAQFGLPHKEVNDGMGGRGRATGPL